MTEDEARDWLQTTLNVPRETMIVLASYIALVGEGQKHQNLVSAGTLPAFWCRHVVDAAQLVTLADGGSWLDIGSGAGLPGIVTAILTGAPTILVEPRARRAEFLRMTADALDLQNVTVACQKVQNLDTEPVDIITARAVGALSKLIQMGMPFAHAKTVWLLPKGKNAQSELASLPRSCQGQWKLHPSVTDPNSHILVGRNMRMKAKS